MFNFPNHLPSAVILKLDNGYICFSSRMESIDGGEITPIQKQLVYTDLSTLLAEVEYHFNETD